MTNIEKMYLEISSLDRDEVKEEIGDSTNNHRTLTISQVVRYLTRPRAPLQDKKLAKSLLLSYNSEKATFALNDTRKFFNNRSDSISYTEFFKIIGLNRVLLKLAREYKNQTLVG